jgi:glutamyl-Q tRNA(Asp) synthetase
MVTTTRFAPSPTGYLHVGHAYAAEFAAQSGDRFLLRFEDIDGSRSKREFEDAMREDLAWWGLSWEEPVRSQSEHMDDYAAALKQLDDAGFIYPCYCTRKEVQSAVSAPHGPEGRVYPGTCRGKAKVGDSYALRLDVAKAQESVGEIFWEDAVLGRQVARPEILGDVVLARKDIATSYHLAVTVDDALQGVTTVTRGMDLLESTHIHRLLQALLDLPVPTWHHHELMTDAEGRRFAKRDQSVTLRALRAEGWTPEKIRAHFFPRRS